MDKRKQRRKIPELAIQETSTIQSILPEPDGSFSLIGPDGKRIPHAHYSSVGYLRQSGKPKILRSIQQNSDDQSDPWKRFDAIGFLDTNSVKSEDQSLFVCSASLLLWKGKQRRFAEVYHQAVLAGYCEHSLNPERIGWADFIIRLQASTVLTPQSRTLLVVDSDKALIPAINDRLEPVCPLFNFSAGFQTVMLPKNFLMAYATSDAGAEHWINREMKRRDKVAREALRKVQKSPNFLTWLWATRTLHITNSFEPDTN